MSKSKAVQTLKTTQADQVQRLQAKHQHELDLLEDMRTFSKSWSALEKDYSQGLQRLASNLLKKRDFPETPPLTDPPSAENRTVSAVWKQVLEQAEKLAQLRMSVSEQLTTLVLDVAKAENQTKAQASKKTFETVNTVHEEVLGSVREMSKAKKTYHELEHLAGLSRKSHMDLQERLTNKGLRRFYESKSTLEKKAQTSEGKLEISEKRSTVARNDYLLMVTGCNAHEKYYYTDILPSMMNQLDGNVYDKFRDALTAVGQIGADSAKSTHEAFERLRQEASMINREFNLQCFLHSNAVFTEVRHHDFVPYREDPVSQLSGRFEANTVLDKEARKWANRVVQCTKTIQSKTKALRGIQSVAETYNKTPEFGSQDASQEADEEVNTIKQTLRRAEIHKRKADAKIDLLREAGVDVDKWIKAAQEGDKSGGTLVKDTLDPASFLDPGIKTPMSGSTASLDRLGREDEFDEFEDDETGDVRSMFDTPSVYSGDTTAFSPAVALYDYQAATAEELTITEGEELEVSERTGDGWVKARNKQAQEGYVPQSYISESTRAQPSTSHVATSVSGTNIALSNSNMGSQHSGVELTILPENEDDDKAVDTTLTEDSVSVGDVTMVRALYEYSALEDEELTFVPGAYIRLLRKDDNGVDDGWWEGELNGTTGVFPSIVVEELSPQESYDIYIRSYNTKEIRSNSVASAPIAAKRAVRVTSDPDGTPLVERADPFSNMTPKCSQTDVVPDLV